MAEGDLIGERVWCDLCRRRRLVEDDSMESDLGGVDHREREVHVVTLECGHEVTATTGRTFPRPDGLGHE